jgi:hypothetical protein
VTQFAKPTLVATTDDGVTLATKFNGAMGALFSSHGGASAPPSPQEGQPWLDTSGATASPPVVRFKLFQSGAWWTLGTLNLQTGVYTVSGALSTGGGILTGPLLFPSGTANNPGIAFSGDENTGIWRPGADLMEFAVGAQGVMRLQTRSGGLIQVNQGLDILGRTRIGWFAAQSSNAQLELNKAAIANSAVITGMQSGVKHWTMELGDGTTGRSDFVLSRYNDAGAYVSSPFMINRATGEVSISGELRANGGAHTPWLEVGADSFAYIDLKVPQSADYSMRLSTGSGGGGAINAIGSLGLHCSNQIDMSVGNGVWAVLSPGGAFICSHQIRAPRLAGGPNNAGALNSWNGDNEVCFRWQDDMLAFRIDGVVDRMIATSTNARDLGYAGGTGGPTGISLNGWDNGMINLFGIYVDAISDARIKKDIVPTTVDALTVLKSVPVRSFQVKADVVHHIGGIGLTPEQRAARPASNDTPVPIGFVAQELMPLIPEAVTVRQQGAESPLPMDLHQINQTMLIPYLVRAIQQLEARIAVLEAR